MASEGSAERGDVSEQVHVRVSEHDTPSHRTGHLSIKEFDTSAMREFRHDRERRRQAPFFVEQRRDTNADGDANRVNPAINKRSRGGRMDGAPCMKESRC